MKYNERKKFFNQKNAIKSWQPCFNLAVMLLRL